MSLLSVARVLKMDLADISRSLRRAQGFLNDGLMPLPRLVKPQPTRFSAAVPGLAQTPVRKAQDGQQPNAGVGSSLSS